MCLEFLRMSETQSSRTGGKRKTSTGILQLIRTGFRNKKKQMGIVLGFFNPELSEFQKKKLIHEFHVFFVFVLFSSVLQKICDWSGWKPGSDKHTKTLELFRTIWRLLQDKGDENNDGKITIGEWLRMWTTFNEQCIKEAKKADALPADRKLPDWLESYVEYKFNLYDRTGDGKIDAEEFEYVLADFGIPAKDARKAFLLFSGNNTKKVDLPYFRELCTDYYRSDDPGALGNFITGKLDFSS
ncbi:calexcitin-2-like [Argopecten irradians]|uniref:calexcitin-2-like n=1 Tax=Argopecten irradians TaxID=31199 RepID=UPI003723AF93